MLHGEARAAGGFGPGEASGMGVAMARPAAGPVAEPIAEVDAAYGALVDLGGEVARETRRAARRADPADAGEDDPLLGVPLDDPVRLYLREIGRAPLLAAADEVRLAQAIARGACLARLAADLGAEPGGAPTPVRLGLALYEPAAPAAGRRSPTCTRRSPAGRRRATAAPQSSRPSSPSAASTRPPSPPSRRATAWATAGWRPTCATA